MRCLALLGMLMLPACDAGLVTQAAPRSAPRETGNSIRFHITVDEADESLAAQLGWVDGVPRASIMMLQNGTATWDTITTDATGAATVSGLSGGLYRIYAERILDLDEAGLVGARRAFGDGRTVMIVGDVAVQLRLAADKSGDLVLSEIGNGTPPPWETGGGSYSAGSYFEVYNNGPSTIYLDGILFGADRIPYTHTLPGPCPTTEAVRTDSLGIHAALILAFPGTGSDYPLGPGQTSLIAWSAIDHRPVHPSLPDLSDADFEIAHFGAADNPDVPNMMDVGLTPFTPGQLNGMNVHFLAAPQDPRMLPVTFRSGNGQDFVRIPRETLLDVAALWRLWPERDAENPPCYPMIAPELHRYEGTPREIGFTIETGYNAVRGLQRRALRRDADGRIILFDTNTSAVDFEHALKTPGWAPEPPSFYSTGRPRIRERSPVVSPLPTRFAT